MIGSDRASVSKTGLFVEFTAKGTVSVQFQENIPKLYLNCAFPQNLYTKKLGKITIFFALNSKHFAVYFDLSMITTPLPLSCRNDTNIMVIGELFYRLKRKIFDALYIKQNKPMLNTREQSIALKLFS